MHKLKTALATLCVLALVITAGCITSSVSGGEVSVSPGIKVQESEEFHYSGHILLSRQGVTQSCISNISVRLYDANQNLIKTKSVGSLCPDDPRNRMSLSINASQQPTYIVIASPDFWTEDVPALPVGYVRSPDLNYYEQYPITSPEQIRPRGEYADTLTPTEGPSDATPADSALSRLLIAFGFDFLIRIGAS